MTCRDAKASTLTMKVSGAVSIGGERTMPLRCFLALVLGLARALQGNPDLPCWDDDARELAAMAAIALVSSAGQGATRRAIGASVETDVQERQARRMVI